MRITKMEISNFRLLEGVNLTLDEKITVIVGRNNSGKTSLTELFRRLTDEERPAFKLADFSLSVHEQFWDALQLKEANADHETIRKKLPSIDVTLVVDYKDDTVDIGPLSHFVVDLDMGCTEAKINVSYQLVGGKIDELFDGMPQEKQPFYKELKERISALYEVKIEAEDPNDETNRKPVEPRRFKALLQFGFINAQRALDSTSRAEKAVIGKILETLFIAASKESADPSGRDTAEQLKTAVAIVQDTIDGDFNSQLQNLYPAFTLFGYPGLGDPRLRTETVLKVETLLSNHTTVGYEGVNGVNLPETYNGLGPRNLIFILLKLFECFKSFTATKLAAGVCLVFIEEPEAHLHPQMQNVFIRKLGEIAALFAQEYNNGGAWPVQFVVTTHSSHIANEAEFDSMRYFMAKPHKDKADLFVTQVKDLKSGVTFPKPEDRKFLHKYMTLTRCDLLFADKCALVEGPTERLLMPRMIEKIDEQFGAEQQLGSQYMSVMEVGGAYAHIFFGLLDFLELRTLIVTDLDTVNSADGNKKCKVSEGTHSSNACINTWFKTDDDEDKPAKRELLEKTDADKEKGCRRLTYQIPHEDDDPCGRSFEDAFMLANQKMFGISAETRGEREQQAWDTVEKAVQDMGKTGFALKYAIEETDWTVPRYIADGLKWLSQNPPSPTVSENTPEVEDQPDA